MIYFFDGTQDGFLTAFLLAFTDENAIVTSRNAQLTLGEKTQFVATDAERAEKARNRLLCFDRDCMTDLSYLMRSGENAADTITFSYFRLIAEQKRPVRKMLANEVVLQAMECMSRVTQEVHRLKGFLRFMESASGALYAPFSPDHDICDLLVPHFRSRLPDFPFVIHDVRRKKAAVYDGKNTFLAPLVRAEVLLSANEREWQTLWKRYYASVNIPERKRLKQMQGYLPVRYWKHLPETVSPMDD